MYIFIDGTKISGLASYKFYKNAYWVFERPIQNDASGSFYISVSDDVELISRQYKHYQLENVFMKATIRCYPNFHELRVNEDGLANRAFGIYEHGKAKGILTPARTATGEPCYLLEIETTSWDGLVDMNTLQEKLWSGTITPKVPFSREQRKIKPLDLLKEILSTRKLNSLQRFLLSMRLLRQ